MQNERESLHGWSVTMAALSIAISALWLWAPDALSPPAMAGLVTGWALTSFGLLFARLRGYRSWADSVTALRVLLAVLLFASFALDPTLAWWKTGVAILILVLDGVDGALARRFGPTERGAVFDMESDAFYNLVTGGVAYLYLGLPAWVLLIGAMRPLYVCGWLLLRRFVPQQSPNSKGTQWGRFTFLGVSIALIVNLAPGIPFELKRTLSAVALIALTLSHAGSARDAIRPNTPV